MTEAHTVEMTLAHALKIGYVRMVGVDDGLPKRMGGLSRMVEDLVKNTQLSYADIVEQVRAAHPEAQTSTKSVASVACVLRKGGTPVPYRQQRVG